MIPMYRPMRDWSSVALRLVMNSMRYGDVWEDIIASNIRMRQRLAI